MRHLVSVAGAAALILLGTMGSSTAAELGWSSFAEVDGDTWALLDTDSRLALLSARADAALASGATVVRLGAEPAIFGEAAMTGTFPWVFMDQALGALAGRGLRVVVTVPDLAPPSALSGYSDFISQLAERYDGDTEFSVEPVQVNYDFPDIDGSGTISVLDWDASNSDKQAWADAHIIADFEIGGGVRAAEDAGSIPEDHYGDQLAVAARAIEAAGGGQRVHLALTDLDEDSKNRFIDRLVDADTDPASFTVGGMRLAAEVAGLDSTDAGAALDNFEEWLGAAEFPNTTRWVGALSIGSMRGADSPCEDARCDERTQANTLAKSVALALMEGYEAVLYEAPVESTDESRSSGLLTVSAEQASAGTIAGATPRPAWAVWQRLGELASEGGEWSKLGALPANVFGVSVGSDRWVLWFDWVNEVSAGADYDDSKKKEIELRDITTASVRVTSLWPESVGSEVDGSGASDVVWTSELVDVVDGKASVLLTRDVVLVEATDEVDAPPVVDEDDTETDTSGGDDTSDGEDTGGGNSGGNDGCSGGAPSGPVGALWLLALGLFGMVRRQATRA